MGLPGPRGAAGATGAAGAAGAAGQPGVDGRDGADAIALSERLPVGLPGQVLVADPGRFIPHYGVGVEFGTGVDGAIDLDGTNTYTGLSKVGSVYTQTADMYATTFRVRNGSTLKPANYRTYASVSITVDAGGAIDYAGLAAVGVAGGGNLPAAQWFGTGASAGGNGRSTAGVGGASTADTGVAGNGAGGNGGGAGANAGGAAGGVTAPTNAQGSVKAYNNTTVALWGRFVPNVTPGQATGGGGGSVGATVATSGGGGGPGGTMLIAAPLIVNNGTITANGGAGANATATTGSAGGGGGGGGGVIIAVCATFQGTLPTVAGGTHGNGAGGGANGTDGNPGTLFLHKVT